MRKPAADKCREEPRSGGRLFSRPLVGFRSSIELGAYYAWMASYVVLVHIWHHLHQGLLGFLFAEGFRRNPHAELVALQAGLEIGDQNIGEVVLVFIEETKVRPQGTSPVLMIPFLLSSPGIAVAPETRLGRGPKRPRDCPHVLGLAISIRAVATLTGRPGRRLCAGHPSNLVQRDAPLPERLPAATKPSPFTTAGPPPRTSPPPSWRPPAGVSW